MNDPERFWFKGLDLVMSFNTET